MVNPAYPKYQLTGVFNLELARFTVIFFKFKKAFHNSFSLDGYDEISLTGPAKAIRNKGEFIIDASDFGIHSLKAEEISGGSNIPSSATIFTKVLEGKGSEAQNNVVCANAAMAIATVTDCNPKKRDLKKQWSHYCQAKQIKLLKNYKS